MRRARHQQGSLQSEKRKRSGETVWVFRWREVQMDGTKRYRKAVIGTWTEYKTESDAQKAADALRLEVNQQTPRQMIQAISFETLVEHYKQHELRTSFTERGRLVARLGMTSSESRTPLR